MQPARTARSTEAEPDPDRTRGEVQRLAADTDRLRAQLAPGDAPDLLAAVIAASHAGR